VSDAARPDVTLRDDPERGRFELLVGGELAGVADYHEQPGLVTILHTEIDPAFEGRGLGSAFVAAMLDDVRAREARVLPVCPFVKAYLQRHRELADLVWRPG
jgi:uncharacterized protein